MQALLFTVGVLLPSSAAVATKPLTDSRITLKNSVVQFQGTPGVSLRVPAESQLIKRSDPASQVAALRAPDGVVIEASVAQVGSTLDLPNAGLRYFDVLRRVVGKSTALCSINPSHSAIVVPAIGRIPNGCSPGLTKRQFDCT